MTRLNQDRDHLKFLFRKIAEKRDKLERAVEEHGQTHDMLVAAKSNDVAGSAHNAELKASANKPVVKICETLVRSWAENVETSNRSLSRWEFKARRQAVIVNRTKEEVEAAEISKAQNATKIEAEIFQMLALTQFVKEL